MSRDPEPLPSLLGPTLLSALAWGITNVVDAVLLTESRLTVTRVGYELGHAMLVASVLLLAITAWRRLGGRPSATLAIALASSAIGLALLPADLDTFVGRQVGPTWATPVTILAALLIAQGPTIAYRIAILTRHPAYGVTIATLGIGLQSLNHQFLHDGYRGAHLMVGLTAFAAIITGLSSFLGRRMERLLSPTRGARVVVGLFAVASLAVLARPPSYTMVIQMLAAEGSILAPWVWLQYESDTEAVPIRPAWLAWLEPPTERPPTPHRLLPRRGIVLLITLDSLREDFLANRDNDHRIPTLARWRDTSVRFTQARAPGAQTAVTLTSLFAGNLYSQQRWTRGLDQQLWPHRDESPRFPELLQGAGVETVTQASTRWLVNEHGIVRGFAAEAHKASPRGWYSRSGQLFPGFKDFVRKRRKGPLFGFMHVLDAHYTVRPKGRDESDEERFWLNLETVDRELAKFEKWLIRLRLDNRCIIILSSDHGEGFGQHDTKRHSSTLYEELIHVPLLIRGRGIAPRVVDEPVSLMDIGPTVLDLFGQPTPASFMGVSLVPWLLGETPAIDRPIVAEGRLKRAMIFPDRIKVIHDSRYRTRELYDLAADPHETRNLIDEDPQVGRERLALLEAFFEAHRLPDPAYEIPFRR